MSRIWFRHVGVCGYAQWCLPTFTIDGTPCDFIRLARNEEDADGEADEPERQRIGSPHRLGLRKSAFTDVISWKAKLRQHAGVMELQGLLHSVRWVLRSAWRQGTRVVILVDAKAALLGATKGRSSSPDWLHVLRQLAAEVLAAGLHLHLLYVPSEDNPADAPSRWRPRRKQRSHTKQVVSVRRTLFKQQVRPVRKTLFR